MLTLFLFILNVVLRLVRVVKVKEKGASWRRILWLLDEQKIEYYKMQ